VRSSCLRSVPKLDQPADSDPDNSGVPLTPRKIHPLLPTLVRAIDRWKGAVPAGVWLLLLTAVAWNGSEKSSVCGEFKKSSTSASSEKASASAEHSSSEPVEKASAYTTLRVPGVLSPGELKAMLKRRGWLDWCSRSRLAGLVLVAADGFGRRKPDGTFEYGDIDAEALLSSLRRRGVGSSGDMPLDPRRVLVRAGVWIVVREPQSLPVRKARCYRFADRYSGRTEVAVPLTPKELTRWSQRDRRRVGLFARNHVEIRSVKMCLGRLEASREAYVCLDELRRRSPSKLLVAQRCLDAFKDREWRVTLDPYGTLHSAVSGCPREIRQHLRVDGCPVSEVDISGAHLLVIVRCLEDGFLNRYGLRPPPEQVEAERKSLVALLSGNSDVYGAGEGRQKRKRQALMALNMEYGVSRAMGAVDRILEDRPILDEAIRRVKARDHATLARYLQRWTSQIVNPAHLALAKQGIPSVPIVDCLMVRDRDANIAHMELGYRIYAATGIRAKVGGRCYEPMRYDAA
jgi:hypothetical protein